jgi:hypothetical protein
MTGVRSLKPSGAERIGFGWLLIACLILVSAAALVNAADFPWLGPTASRQVLSLVGRWELPEGNPLGLEAVSVPFAIFGQQHLRLEKTFSLDSTAQGRQLWLVCYGAHREARFWLNGRFLGTHSAGYTSFVLPIDPAFVRIGGENRLRAEIDGTLHPSSGLPLLHRPGGWPEITGIFREIYLLLVPPVALENATVRTQELVGDRAELAFTAELARSRLDTEAPGGILAEVVDPSSGTVLAMSPPMPVEFGNSLRCSVSWKLSVRGIRPWSPSAPALYRVRISLVDAAGAVADVWETRTGIRTVSVDAEGIVLNSEPFRLQAVEWLEAPPYWGYPDRIASLLNEMKAAGCNAIRLVGYPPHPALAAVADSIGLFLLEEIPLWKVPDPIMSDPRMQETATDYVAEMVKRDQAHPAVLAWGLGVGLEGGKRQTASVLKMLREAIRSIDDRPCYSVTDWATAFRKTAPWPVDFLLVDVSGLEPQRLQGLPKTALPVFPIVGYLANFPGAAPAGADRAEENRAYQLWVAGSQLLQRGRGLIIRSWTDWQTPGPGLPLGIPPSKEMRYGVVSPTGETRLSFFVLRSLFAGDERPRMRFEAVARGQENTFVLLALLLVGLFLWHFRRDRRFRGNLRRVFLYPSSIYEDVRARRKISGYHTFLQGFFASAGMAVVVSSFLAFSRRSWLADEVSGLLLGNGLGKAVFIWLAWHPLQAIAFFTLVGLFSLSLFSICFWLLALVRAYLPIGQAFTFVFWISTAFLPALIWGAVAYRAMLASPSLAWFTVLLKVAMGSWFLLRFVRGTSVILRIPWWASVGLLCALALLVGLPLATLLQRQSAVFDYCAYYFHLLR